jgi:subtilisin family serine protease
MLAVFALAVAWLPLLSSGAGAEPPADGDVVPGAWIVTVAPGASPDDVAADHGRRLGASVDHVYRHAARGYAARMSSSAAARAAADPRVASVVPDRYVSIAAKPGGSGTATPPPEEAPPTGVQRVYGGTSPGVAVAVIDTGIDTGHPDLKGLVKGGVNCTSGTSYKDGNGHGTHVAGTISALKGNGGVVGVAPGTFLYAVRVLNNAGSGTWSSVKCGVDWVAARATTIKVANMSLGGGGSDGECGGNDALHNAICDAVEAGVTFVVAAGNESDDAGRHVPAAYDEVITVSALADSDGTPGGTWSSTACRSDQEETLADFSNHGTDVDLIAPGVCIRSTWKGGGYSTISGTSMASPHVAAGAALYIAAHPGSTPAQVQAGLIAEGGTDWVGDADGIKEPLLRVDTL